MGVYHFGSLYTMTDYTSESHNLYMTASFYPTSKLTLTGKVNFDQSKAEMDEVLMPEVSDEVFTYLSHLDFTFDDMHTYSSIDYRLLSFGLGVQYRLTPQVTVTADADYADLEDKTGYVYGDESGTLFMIRSGVRIDF